jgi:hypothetical protein
MKTGRLYRLEWSSPYTSPPDGAPRVLAEIFILGNPTQPPAELMAVPHSLGGGYSLTSRHISPPSKQLPPETLARVRQQRLARRVNAKTPMFAEQFIAAEWARKPEYYAGITDPDIEERKQAALQREKEEWFALCSRPNRLVVYGQEPEACRSKSEELRAEMQEIRARILARTQP